MSQIRRNDPGFEHYAELFKNRFINNQIEREIDENIENIRVTRTRDGTVKITAHINTFEFYIDSTGYFPQPELFPQPAPKRRRLR